MSNTIMGRRKGTNPPAVMVLALVPVTLVVIATLSSVLFPATGEQAAPTLAQCRAISEAHDRLACYDSLEGKPLPLPAKGGLAVAP